MYDTVPGCLPPLSGLLLSPTDRIHQGRTGGWDWATNTFSVCGEQTDRPDDDDSHPISEGVVPLLEDALVQVGWTVAPVDVMKLGGVGWLRDWGMWVLDRVRVAALWCGDGADDHPLVLRPEGPVLFVSCAGRAAVVMGIEDDTDDQGWWPRVDLPVTALR